MSLMFLMTMLSAFDPLVLFDATRVDATGVDGSGAPHWRPLHDTVMGGVSRGDVRSTDQEVRLEGHVSLENNGGFASFRLDLAGLDLRGRDALRLRVKGDGKTYKLGLRFGPRSNVRWQASFATQADGAWCTVVLPLASFVPTYRGRLVADAPALELLGLREVALSIADAQAGPFRIELRSLEACAFADEKEPGTLGSYAQRTAELAGVLEGARDDGVVRDALRRFERTVVLASTGRIDPWTSMQMGALHSRMQDLAARDMRCFSLIGEDGRLAGQRLDPRVVRGLRRAWAVPSDRWQVLLVGKDGDVKQRWDAPVDPDQIFACVDAMPMRRAEARTRGLAK